MEVKKRPSDTVAFFGTVIIWVLLTFLFSFYSLLPKKENFKTVQIRLESPVASKKTMQQEAAPPKAQDKSEVATQTPPPPAASPQKTTQEKTTSKTTPQKKESSPAPKKATEKPATTKSASSKPSTSKPAPSKPVQKEQKLQKSMDELLAEQRNTKTTTKSDFDWSQFDDDEAESFSSTSSTSTASTVAKNNVNALQGTAASVNSSNSSSSAVSSSSSNSNNYNTTASANTTAALGKIASSSYNFSGNGVKSDAKISTASASDGKIAVAMGDGTVRILLEPKTPVIELSEQAASTIEGKKELPITFTVTADGRVPVNGIKIGNASTVSLKVQQEISAQISRWRFQSASSDGTATFVEIIELK